MASQEIFTTILPPIDPRIQDIMPQGLLLRASEDGFTSNGCLMTSFVLLLFSPFHLRSRDLS
jgi:hypothetical protein